ncbi:MAG: general secretion pathway protein GspF [Gammaproteobacteria bacterium]|nr:general secretion pathway protein GspF [Gammaproteobacteria bacterium]
MAVQRARSAEEYAGWVEQAKFEVEDMRACVMYDQEEIGESGRFPAFLEPLSEAIESIYQSMCSGEYSFGREDLPFVEILDRHANDIPFYLLLTQINETHRYGLDVDE